MINLKEVVRHFAFRAPTYDISSRWCTDDALAARLIELLKPRGTESVLDVACGTGLVARFLRPYVNYIVGLDITPEMLGHARPHLDDMLLADAEALPCRDGQFDLVICRQGIQFLDAPRAVTEMVRVARPGARVCLVNLCAYGADDRDEYFEILHLRNPVRRNFFLREDLIRLLEQAGCRHVDFTDHVSVEAIDVWSENAAIGEQEKTRIRELYLRASPAFRKHHRVELDSSGRIRDHMLFGIGIGLT
jgi:SAM-dependent methyltransferase